MAPQRIVPYYPFTSLSLDGRPPRHGSFPKLTNILLCDEIAGKRTDQNTEFIAILRPVTCHHSWGMNLSRIKYRTHQVKWKCPSPCIQQSLQLYILHSFLLWTMLGWGGIESSSTLCKLFGALNDFTEFERVWVQLCRLTIWGLIQLLCLQIWYFCFTEYL